MKRLFLMLTGFVLIFSSCRNFDIAHPDFKYTSGYFPYQFPVRTLVLGNYIYDNSNDNNHKFIISLHMGGVYDNTKDRVFEVEVDNSLSDSLLFSVGGDTIRTMPAKYYILASDNITIPKGKLYGGVEVQLSDAFFKDSNAINLCYVIPLKIKSANDVDTILNGKTENPDADLRIASDWSVPPKNFTMFAVKYINEYHGTYFHYGKSEIKDAMGNVIEDTTYSDKEVVENPTVNLITTGRYQVAFNSFLQSDTMTGEVKMLLDFDGNSCKITAPAGSPYTISGSGEFKPGAYEWGNKKRDGITLNYTVSNGEFTYTANDVLVSRDRDVVMETYSPVKY